MNHFISKSANYDRCKHLNSHSIFQEILEIINIRKMAQSSSSINSYKRFVVVAEDHYKMFSGQIACEQNNGHLHKTGTKFSMFLAGFEWECTFTPPDLVTVENKSLARKKNTEVYVEILLCDDKFRPFSEFPMRRMLTADESVWQHQLVANHHKFLILTVRVLKDRPFFPDFTSKDVPHNAELHLGNKVFYINKEFLAASSPFFNILFSNHRNDIEFDGIKPNGEAMTEENAATFHDFLISLPNMNFQEALPNVQNVAGLLALAESYQVNSLLAKCERHLMFCREMPYEERFILAQKFGLNEAKAMIAQEQQALENCLFDGIENL